MNINQRFMYVGIGGTGLKIGKELERAMRRDVCGPDGRALIDQGGPFASYLPDQLPPFFQTLYVDYELAGMRAQQLLLSDTPAVVEATATFVTSINPSVPSYSAAASHLRNTNSDIVRDWLPGSSGEPAVAPLSAGAGQFPTVGRAALFNVLEDHGTTALFNEIDRPLKALAASMGDLQARATGGRAAITDVTIYVGFSIAGGTGTGLFLDMIHLLSYRAQAVLGSDVPVRIIPLVVLPSVYESDMNAQKQRASKLNSARALIDLQQFVDQQNTAAAGERFVIDYPGGLSIEVPPATTPVAFLHGGATVLKSDEMFRSISRGVIAQVSTTVSSDLHAEGAPAMSWLADLVNKDPIFGVMHASGIGRKPFSSALTASLSMPSEGIADALTTRLIARGFDQYLSDNLASYTDADEVVKGALVKAGLGDVFTAPRLTRDPSIDLNGRKGTQEINDALGSYKTKWRRTIASMPKRVGGEIADVAVFDWKSAFKYSASVEGSNPVRAARTLIGYSASDSESLRQGMKGRIETRGLTANGVKEPSATVKKKLIGSLRGSSPEVHETVKQLDQWGKRSAHKVWGDEWQAKHSLWAPTVGTMDQSIKKLLQDLRMLTDQHLAEADRTLRSAEDSGIVVRSVLLANVTTSSLYHDLLRRVADAANLASPDEAAVMNYLIDQAMYSWDSFIETYFDLGHDTDAAWRELHNRVRSVVERLLVEPASDLDDPILPTLSSVLDEAAAGSADNSEVVEKVSAALTGMIPDGVMPRGAGAPEILVTYPSPDENLAIEQFLGDRLADDDSLKQLMNRSEASTRFQHAPDGDAVTVTVSIFGQGLLDMPEAASLLRFWLDTLPELRAGDKVAWRQRASYSDLGRIARPRDRAVILQRLLGAAFDGRVTMTPATLEADATVAIDMGEEGATRIEFALPEFLDVSPMGWLPYAFEDMAVRMDAAQADVVDWLNSYTPKAMRTGSVNGVHAGDLFRDVIEAQPAEIKLLEGWLQSERLGRGGNRKVELYLDFWTSLLPAAMTQPYGGEGDMDAVTFGSMRDLCVALDIDISALESPRSAKVA